MRGRVRPDAIGRLCGDCVQIDWLVVQLHAARLHLVEIQHLVDHPIEPLCVFVDVAGVLAHLSERQVLVRHHFRKPLNAGERRSELVRDSGHEVGLQLELRNRTALLLERLGRGDRDAQLVSDGFDESHVIGAPFARAVDLRQRERALELAADAYRRGGDGDATALSGVLRRWFGETAIVADVGHHHRPSESRGELRHRYAPRPAAHGDHPGCGPLVGDVQVIFRHARRNDGAGDAEHAAQLVDRAAEDLVRIETGAGALRDPVHERLALGARLGLRHRQRTVDRARDVLPHDHRHLHAVGDERPGAIRHEQ